MSDQAGMTRAIGTAILVFSSLGVILFAYPSFSKTAATYALVLASIGIVSVALGASGHNWYLQVAYTNSWLLFFLGFSTRAWSSVLPPVLPWAAALLVAYTTAWLMPVMFPGLSALLLREQTAPQTSAGLGCIRVATAILPSAAGIGAIIGLLGARTATTNAVAVLVGAVCAGVAVGGAQVFSEQFWRARPWIEAGEEAQPRHPA